LIPAKFDSSYFDETEIRRTAAMPANHIFLALDDAIKNIAAATLKG